MRSSRNPFHPEQKLRMLQNSVDAVIAYVKQIGDLDIVRGHPPLDLTAIWNYCYQHVQHKTRNTQTR